MDMYTLPSHLDRLVLPCSIYTRAKLETIAYAYIIAECRALIIVHGERFTDSVCYIHLNIAPITPILVNTLFSGQIQETYSPSLAYNLMSGDILFVQDGMFSAEVRVCRHRWMPLWGHDCTAIFVC